MDLLDLKTFMAIADTGSFSQAAELLHVTQPAVSKRLANLEQHFATPLIERLPRKAVLTDAGKFLRQRAATILREVDNTQAEILNLHSSVAGVLHLATSHHIGLHRLPKEIRRFSRAHPEAEFDLQFLASEDAEQALLAGSVQLALVTLPEQVKAPFTAHELWLDRLVFVAEPDHPLTHNTDLQLSDLAEYRALLPAPHTVTFQLISSLFAGQSLPLATSMPTNYLETIKMMVSVGLGWGVLPDSMLDDSVAELALETNLYRKLGVIYDSRRTLSRVAEAFLRQLRGEAPPTAP
ncbi:LysR family transcriptional regulator [Hahella sp. HN01]|uniref:LysR family transcriptional regulator n=1 Tax=Hahella sp. HN01 TaxID=2847262 RepID=UPI001C1EAC48|nr:LysR family transcriptional regulator [Hahella sp. HN01]MBU6950803.1 LysR family transcriptional regulator [Hahella sp. HN01]